MDFHLIAEAEKFAKAAHDSINHRRKYTDKASEPALRKGAILDNSSVVAALTKDGSRITDWEKRSTRSAGLPTGQKVQVHFYRNSFTGEVNYVHRDFKVKGSVDVFPGALSPQPILGNYRPRV